MYERKKTFRYVIEILPSRAASEVSIGVFRLGFYLSWSYSRGADSRFGGSMATEMQPKQRSFSEDRRIVPWRLPSHFPEFSRRDWGSAQGAAGTDAFCLEDAVRSRGVGEKADHGD